MKFHGEHSNAFNYISENYKFRFNVVTGLLEFKSKKGKSNWIPYDDRLRKGILLELMQESIKVPDSKVDIFIESPEFSKDYNPFKSYIKGLNKWKKKDPDFIKNLASTVPVQNRELFYSMLKRYMVGCIDNVMVDNSVNDICLILQSSTQGVGKTRWMRKLLPTKLNDYFYEGPIDTRNKDHVLWLSKYWFMHLDELEALRGNELSAIKSYITRQNINLRKAFGRYDSSYVRRANILGSVNDDKFLTDTTGNRRWLVFKVIGMIDYQHDVNPDDFWAQAYYLWKNNYQHWLNQEEIKQLNENNEKFRSLSLEEELLLRFFDFNDKKGKGELFSSSEIIEKIIFNVPKFVNKLSVQRMGKALSKHSLHKKMKGGIQKYYVEYLGIDEFVTQNPSPKVNNNAVKEIDEDDDLPF